jgi:hypothetical protein
MGGAAPSAPALPLWGRSSPAAYEVGKVEFDTLITAQSARDRETEFMARGRG